MEFYHEPIMLNECMEYLLTNGNGVYVDGTLGGGGHTEAMLKRTEYGKVIGVDLDQNAIDSSVERLSKYKGRFLTVHDNFHNIKNIVSELGINEVDGVLYDLGVSSFQLDCAERGFSYQHDAPLDMRMNKSQGFSAFDVVNKYDENRLFEIIKDYGEENWARRIAKYIVEYREKEPIETTGKLVEIIKNAIPAKARRNGPHPAKRTFQAIRIEVNDELAPLKKTIEDTVDILKPGGRLCVITFHSLEDRIVKHTFKKLKNPCTCPPDIPVCICGKKPKIDIITGKPIVPSDDELYRNSRARSAKLRVAEKL